MLLLIVQIVFLLPFTLVHFLHILAVFLPSPRYPSWLIPFYLSITCTLIKNDAFTQTKCLNNIDYTYLKINNYLQILLYVNQTGLDQFLR